MNEIIAPPDHLFRTADDIICPDCGPEINFDRTNTGVWYLETQHIYPCEGETEVIYG